MEHGSWLPKWYKLPNGLKIRTLLHYGRSWQIFDTNGSTNVLVADDALAKNWTESGILEQSLLIHLEIQRLGSFSYLCSDAKYALTPVENSETPKNTIDALAFAQALKESRKIVPYTSSKVLVGNSFHNAVYVEQYSRLLPIWEDVQQVDDEVVLSTWITGGVAISTKSFRRLADLTGWMPVDELIKIIEAAGLSVSVNEGLLAKRKPVSSIKTAEKNIITKDSVNNEAILKDSTKTFSLPGRPQLESFFNEHVVDIIFNSDKYKALGIDFPSAIVLHGPPGCGKTYAVERLVEFIDWPSYSINSSSIGSPFIHETGKKISEVFDKAIDNAPSVIIIDEMESFLSDRLTGGSSSLHHVEEVAEFLRRIPEAVNNKVLVIAMTNLIEMIDAAILRRGRFDHIIEVGMPSKEEVASLIDSLLSKLPKDNDLNMDEVINLLTGKALSDATFVIREAARIAAKNGKNQLDQSSIDAALSSLPKNQEKNACIGFIADR